MQADLAAECLLSFNQDVVEVDIIFGSCDEGWEPAIRLLGRLALAEEPSEGRMMFCLGDNQLFLPCRLALQAQRGVDFLGLPYVTVTFPHMLVRVGFPHPALPPTP